MIFDGDDFEEVVSDELEPVSARRLLTSCADEATRLASAIDSLDREVAALLDDLRVPSTFLQGIDLVRQEAAGLAAVLRLVVTARTGKELIETEVLSGILTLRSQHERLAMNRK